MVDSRPAPARAEAGFDGRAYALAQAFSGFYAAAPIMAEKDADFGTVMKAVGIAK